VQNGLALHGGGILVVPAYPPGVSMVTVSGVVVRNNRATDYSGGGIFVDIFGILTVRDSIIEGNTATGYGGGILVDSSSLIMSETAVTGNSAELRGGGIMVDPFLYGSVIITNSTISQNTATEVGGVLALNGPMTISSSTITGNSADSHIGGIAGHGYDTVLTQTIIAGNLPTNCHALPTGDPSVTSDGHNLSSDATCGLDQPTDLEEIDPLLLPLADNGGPTPTHALSTGSPAIDAGGLDCDSIDQRGVPRPQDGDGDGIAYCDIGAFELERRVLLVDIDVKPGSEPNSINPRSRGVIPLAIFGSADFDVADVDVSTLRFGSNEAAPRHNGHLEDVNFDAIMDLVVHFRTQEIGIQCGDTEATLTGNLLTGQPIEGTDSIETVGCRFGMKPLPYDDRDKATRRALDGIVDFARED
jgi:hypothetical protein